MTRMIVLAALLLTGCATAEPKVYEPKIHCDVSDAYTNGVKCEETTNADRAAYRATTG